MGFKIGKTKFRIFPETGTTGSRLFDVFNGIAFCGAYTTGFVSSSTVAFGIAAACIYFGVLKIGHDIDKRAEARKAANAPAPPEPPGPAP